MSFDFRIYIIVGIFIIVCISLMVFNFVIMYYGRRNAMLESKIRKWTVVLYEQTTAVSNNKSVSKHQRLLLQKLSNAENLVAHACALRYIKSDFPKDYSDYMRNNYAAFHKLAVIYSRKDTIERTCYANFIYNFPQIAYSAHGKLADILISFMEDDADVYCCANVLRALCKIGSIQGVVVSLQIINHKALFMHNQILTNTLSDFTGDKHMLGELLWKYGQQWNDNIFASVIQFITGFSNNYRETFLPVLQKTSGGTKARTAIILYYEKYMYEPVQPILIEFIANPTDIRLTIEAINALALYPASDTISTLKYALYSPKWQIRYAASSTLIKLLDTTDLLALLQGESNYAREIVDYMLELEALLLLQNVKRPLPLLLQGEQKKQEKEQEEQEEMDGEKVTV